MKNFSINKAGLMILILVCALAVSGSAAAETYGLSGDGKTTVSFYVESHGKSSLILKQRQGTCTETSYTKAWEGITGTAEEWGKYHIKVMKPSGSYYTEEWDSTFNGEEYTIRFQDAGIFCVTITPYTQREMSDSWTLDIFGSWNVPPHWWIDMGVNCSYTTQRPSIVIPQSNAPCNHSRTQKQNYHQEYETCDDTVHISKVCYDVYCLDCNTVVSKGAVESSRVEEHTFSNGVCYLCKQKAAASGWDEWDGGSRSSSSRRVYPTGWRHGEFLHGCSNLNNLFDGNYSTSFYWNISRGDYHVSKGRNEPPITVLFNHESIGGIGLVQAGYSAVLTTPHFKITCGNGNTYNEYVSFNSYSTGLETGSFSRVYSDVVKIELYLDDGVSTYESRGGYDCYQMEMEFYSSN